MLVIMQPLASRKPWKMQSVTSKKEGKTILTKYNQEIIIVNDEYAKIHIVSKKHGEFDVIFDIEDIEKISNHKWCVNKYKNTKSNCDYEKIYCV